MSVLAQYLSKQETVESLKAQLEALSTDSTIQRNLEFRDRLLDLMAEYDVDANAVKMIVDPASLVTEEKAEAPRKRRPRRTKVYRNPYTDDVVETRGGNHNVLKAWKKEFGKEEVESWLVAMKDPSGLSDASNVKEAALKAA